MKALITGINGFVGPYLKNHLIEHDIKVVGTDLNSGEDVDYVLDLLDKPKIEELIIEEKPDFIFHLAAQSSVKFSFENPLLTREINVEGTNNIMEAIKKNIPRSKILIVCSAEVYGTPQKIPISEDHQLKPNSPYGESKVEQEELIKKYGLNSVILRSFPHTGPGQLPIFVVSEFAKKIVEIENGAEPIIFTGNLEVERDFSDVNDIVSGYYLAIEKCNYNEPYNICSGKGYKIRDLLNMLIGMSSKEISVEVDPSKFRKKETMALIGDNTKFREKTGWTPKIKIEDTLTSVLEYWRKNI